MHTTATILVVAGLAVAVCLGQDACSTSTSCDMCTNAADCGWCMLNNQCETGNAAGSASGCAAPNWAWTNKQCLAPPQPTPYNTCSDYTTCGPCTGVANCGFCTATGTCEVGSPTGSLSGDCSGPSWVWTNQECSETPAPTADPCNTFNGQCFTCTDQGGCGYCLSCGVCESGTESGSTVGNCTGSNWVWSSVSCSGKPAQK